MKFEINSQNLFCSKCRYNIQKTQRDFGIALGSRSVLRRGRLALRANSWKSVLLAVNCGQHFTADAVKPPFFRLLGDWHFVPTPGRAACRSAVRPAFRSWRSETAVLPVGWRLPLTRQLLEKFSSTFFKRLWGGGQGPPPRRSGWDSYEEKIRKGDETVRWTVSSWETLSRGFPVSRRDGVEIDAAHQLLEKGLVRHKGDVHFAACAAKPAFFRLGGDWRFALTPGRMDTARKGWILLFSRLCLHVCWRKRPTCGVAHTGTP